MRLPSCFLGLIALLALRCMAQSVVTNSPPTPEEWKAMEARALAIVQSDPQSRRTTENLAPGLFAYMGMTEREYKRKSDTELQRIRAGIIAIANVMLQEQAGSEELLRLTPTLATNWIQDLSWVKSIDDLKRSEAEVGAYREAVLRQQAVIDSRPARYRTEARRLGLTDEEAATGWTAHEPRLKYHQQQTAQILRVTDGVTSALSTLREQWGHWTWTGTQLVFDNAKGRDWFATMTGYANDAASTGDAALRRQQMRDAASQSMLACRGSTNYAAWLEASSNWLRQAATGLPAADQPLAEQVVVWRTRLHSAYRETLACEHRMVNLGMLAVERMKTRASIEERLTLIARNCTLQKKTRETEQETALALRRLYEENPGAGDDVKELIVGTVIGLESPAGQEIHETFLAQMDAMKDVLVLLRDNWGQWRMSAGNLVAFSLPHVSYSYQEALERLLRVNDRMDKLRAQ